jgi:hypothetical protein
MYRYVLLIVTFAKSPIIEYLIVDADDYNVAVEEGKRFDSFDNFSYTFLINFFRIIRIAMVNNRAFVFTSALEMLQYIQEYDITLVDEQVLAHLADGWSKEFYG